ncbi:MAG TPA: glycosyltransferase family A protein [Roseomonas sp.]|jgi:glycosyltransferase involved in cell wall biosynthesis
MAEISVVVPTYNRAGLIGQTLDAIFAQTRPPDEIIVVDDGSTDDTRSVLARYAGRLHAMHIVNGGDLVARNVGLRAAQGRLVAFCDSDDLWAPDFLATMSAQWQADPELTACYSDFRILRDGALSLRTKFQDAPDIYWNKLRLTGPETGKFDTSIVTELLAFQPFFPSCMMVSRAAFLDAGGWDEGVSRVVGCDFATALRMAARPPLGVVLRPLVAIRKHTGNHSGNTEAMNLGDANVLEYVLRTRPELAPVESAIRRSIAKRRREALESAFSRGDLAAVGEIERAIPRDGRQVKLRLKTAISHLPEPIGFAIATALTRRFAQQMPPQVGAG